MGETLFLLQLYWYPILSAAFLLTLEFLRLRENPAWPQVEV